MLIRQRGTLKKFDPRPGTPNQEAYTVIQVVVATAQFTDGGAIADGYRYVGHTIEMTLRADALPMPVNAERPMERLWATDSSGEHTRPGPTETCSECGKVIGEDADAAFYTPIAGPPRPVCGACALAIDDEQTAAEAEAEEQARDDEVTQFQYPDGRVVTLDAEGETVEDRPAAASEEPSDTAAAEPLGDADTREVGPLGRSTDINPEHLGDFDEPVAASRRSRSRKG